LESISERLVSRQAIKTLIKIHPALQSSSI